MGSGPTLEQTINISQSFIINKGPNVHRFHPGGDFVAITLDARQTCSLLLPMYTRVDQLSFLTESSSERHFRFMRRMKFAPINSLTSA